MIKTRQKIFLILAAIILIVVAAWYINVYTPAGKAQKNESDNVLLVSIDPIKYLISEIVGDDFEITTLLPAGTSPETYELTPRQIVSLSDASLVFTTGLIDFEIVMADKIRANNDANIVVLSTGITLENGECAYSHANDSSHSSHRHSVDPHIWTSPRCLKIMSENAYKAISGLYPDSVKYRENYLSLQNALENMDVTIGNKLRSADIKYFLIYHPALTYYADDYGIEQIPIEVDGKEPSAEYMKSVVDKAGADSVKVILYQKHLNVSVVETIAKDIGATAVEFDPLAGNVPENLLWVTDMITAQ